MIETFVVARGAEERKRDVLRGETSVANFLQASSKFKLQERLVNFLLILVFNYMYLHLSRLVKTVFT